MANNHDDLDAVRALVEALESFDSGDRKRIVRWALEKLGDTFGENLQSTILQPQEQMASPHEASPTSAGTTVAQHLQRDIKAFVREKNPISDMQFAAVVAYYYAFEAPDIQKKEEINSGDLQEACRLTGRERLQNPGQTLRNTAFDGLLDKGSEKGNYKINTVGENLVAITLPGNENSAKPRQPKKSTKKKGNKKVVSRKKVAKKASAKKKSGKKSYAK